MSGEERSLSTYNIPIANLDSVMRHLNMGPEDNLPFKMEVVYTSIYEDEYGKVDSNASQP